jgi:hypothetical protein
MTISRFVLLRMKNVSGKFVEKIKTHIVYSTTFFFFPENHAVYEIMWKNMLETERRQITIYMAHALCVVDN